MKKESRLQQASSFTLIVSFICLSLVGLALASLLPLKLHPDHSLPELNISYTYPDASAAIIESELSSPLEKALSNLAGIENIESISSEGFGRIRIQFDKYADIDKLRFQASTLIRSIWLNLPSAATYPTISSGRSSDENPQSTLSYSISGPYASSQIQDDLESKLLPLLREVKDVGEITLSGAKEQELLLAYDYEQISTLGISPSSISIAIAEQFENSYVGLAKQRDSVGGSKQIRLRLSERDNKSFDLSKIFVLTIDKRLLPLDRLLTITNKEKPQRNSYRVNGLNSVYLRLESTSSANQIQVAKQLNRIVQAEQKLMPAYTFTKLYDSSDAIRQELENILLRSGISIVLLLLFTFLATRNLRYITIVSISLAVNISIAFALYYLLGLEMQLYTLAAITISLSFVIDNSIVMIEQLIRRGNRTVITAIMATTLTTISAMLIVFFLPEAQRKNLADFAIVIIVNLAVSIAVALFLVPALFDRLSFKLNQRMQSYRKRYRTMQALNTYRKIAAFLARYKRWVFLTFVLLFGIPIFLAPKKIAGDSTAAKLYNNTLGSKFYQNIRPYSDLVLGGFLRPFLQQISSGTQESWTKPVIDLQVQMPAGSSSEATNEYVSKIERFLSQASGVDYFETQISGHRSASIKINFKESHAKGNYPYELHQGLVGRILSIGGGYCRTSGLKNLSFNNIKEEDVGMQRIKVMGYNYEELLSYCQRELDSLAKKNLTSSLSIVSNLRYSRQEKEFVLEPMSSNQALLGFGKEELLRNVNERSRSEKALPELFIDGKAIQLALAARSSKEESKWNLENTLIKLRNRSVKLKDYGEIMLREQPQNIFRENKNYVLYICFNYQSNSPEATERFIDKEVERINQNLPIGYKAMRYQYESWEDGKWEMAWALIGIIILMFFITSILFNSLRFALIVVSIIPISFIGIFIVFRQFRLPFDEGGFAAMIILSGITVNASIYLINDYLYFRRNRKGITKLDAYIRAVRNKTFSIALTVSSTILGFIPFVAYKSVSPFWYSLSMGVIFGMLFSSIMLFVILPAFLSLRKGA